jgi:hypothetical protein
VVPRVVGVWQYPVNTYGDVEHLLPEYEKLLVHISATRAALKAELQNAITATAGNAR